MGGDRTAANLRTRQYEFAAHLRDPDNNPAPADVEDRRMEIYRDLFFNNISSFLANSYPVLSAQLGEERWRLLMRDFFRDHHSASPLFPQVSREFLNYLADERGSGTRTDPEPDPPFMYELAHYEWVETALKLGPDHPAPEGLKIDGDLLEERPVLSGSAWAMTYSWPVAEFGAEESPGAPAEQPQHYLVYRNVDGHVRSIRLNAVSARLFQLLEESPELTGQRALETIAAELGHTDTGKVVAGGQQILEKWRELGIVTGTVAP